VLAEAVSDNEEPIVLLENTLMSIVPESDVALEKAEAFLGLFDAASDNEAPTDDEIRENLVEDKVIIGDSSLITSLLSEGDKDSDVSPKPFVVFCSTEDSVNDANDNPLLTNFSGSPVIVSSAFFVEVR
jgi:hypothetical protein